MKKYILMSILLLFSSLVLATAPSTPSTLSPLDEAIYFNDPTLVCSGSTDAESNPINYTFYQRYDDGATSEPTGQATWTYTYSGSADHSESYDAATERWNLWLEAEDHDWANIRSDSKFNFTDYDSVWTVDWNCDDGGAQFTEATILIDDIIVYTCGVASCCQTSAYPVYGSNPNIDISAYQDGALHSIRLYLKGNGNTDETTLSFYSRDNLLEVKQNSSSTTFDWENIDLGSLYKWTCNACDNNSECSSYTDIRNLQTMSFTICTSGNKAQQFNLLNETESQDLGVYTQDCSYSLTSAFDTRAYNFALAGLSYYNFCLNPINVSVTLNGFCQYDSTLSGYSYARQYYFDDVTLDGATLKNYSLYQLEDALSTAITFSVTEAGVPLENRIIQIQRYDISTGNYRTVSMLKTDANGQDISYLEQTTAFYKVCVFEIGNPNPVYCSSAFHLTSDSYSIALTTSSALSWSNIVGVAHNLTFDNGSDQFELTYSDPNEKTTQFCLDVFEERFTQRVLVSSNCLSANSGTVQTSVTPTNGTTYSAFAFATLFTNTSGQYVSDSFLLSQITHSYGMSEAFQNNGLFFIWLLVAIFSLLSFYSPSLSLLLAPLPIIFGSFSGIIAIPMGTALALYLGFIILAVIVGGKE